MKRRNLLAIFATLALSAGAMAAFTACDAQSNISAEDSLQSLTIATAPTKTKYVAGETFDPSGMVVKAVYQSGREEEVSDYTYSPNGALSLGITKITISWGNKTVTQRITVKNDITNVSIKTAPTRTEYYAGESFDPAGMVLLVTYENGEEEDVTVSGSSASYKKDALTKEDTQITITYGGKTVTQEITFAEGVFIEAENGIINADNNPQDHIFDDATGRDDAYNATGGLYVADLKAGESVTFIFNSDKAGKGSIAFRMASQYLKKDDNWTPIWMGDCQFNKIVEFYVNGEKYDIPDTAILPGGGSEDGSPDSNLWFNWQEVVFDNIDLVEGKNTVELKFIPHEYTDTSEAAYSGSFTANIDSLIVTSAECKITEYKMSIDSLTVAGVTLQEIDGVAYYVLTGKIAYTGYSGEQALALLTFDLQENGGTWGYYLESSKLYDVSVEEDGTFTFKVALNTLADGGYISHFSSLTDGKLKKEDLKLTAGVEDGKSITIGTITYTLILKEGGTSSEDYFGCVGVYIENSRKVELTSVAVGNNARLEVREEGGSQKVYYVISGGTVEYTSEGYEKGSAEEKEGVIDAIRSAVYFDLQGNPYMQTGDWGGDWNLHFNNKSDHIITLSEDGKTFEIAVDITSLTPYCYTTHCDTATDGSHDYKPDTESFTQQVTLGDLTYEMVFVKGGAAEQFWGCVGIRVTEVSAKEEGSGEESSETKGEGETESETVGTENV
jgi:hypothetical protein